MTARTLRRVALTFWGLNFGFGLVQMAVRAPGALRPGSDDARFFLFHAGCAFIAGWAILFNLLAAVRERESRLP